MAFAMECFSVCASVIYCLGMQDDTDLLWPQIKQPTRLDHLQRAVARGQLLLIQRLFGGDQVRVWALGSREGRCPAIGECGEALRAQRE